MNDMMLTRICKIIAQTYAIPDYDVWSAYEKLGSIDKTIELASIGTLNQISGLQK